MRDTGRALDRRLIGRWVSDPRDSSASLADSISFEFLDDGSLTYTVHGRAKDEVMLLRFHTDGENIVTDQASAPREERTPYSFSADGKLLLLRDGQLFAYVRSEGKE
jgi:hypothetical protein